MEDTTLIEKELVDFVIWVGACEIVLTMVLIWFGSKIFKKSDDVEGKNHEIDYLNHKIIELQYQNKILIDSKVKTE